MGANNAYLALGYACNEKCRCCPLIHKNDREKFIPLDRLLKEADQIVSYGVRDVTLSGGEPTIHQDLFQLIAYFHTKGINVHILSNGERFSDKSYANEFLELQKNGVLTVTTTFHSWNAAEHEYQNGSQGSFLRSLHGLQYLDRNGVQISVKHCITANNYRQLPQYIQFVIGAFSSQAEIQLWGIDLNGLERKFAQENFVDFQLVKPYIEEAIDVFESSGRAKDQILSINNLPLCMCDCYYWKYFTSPKADSYVDHKKGGDIMEANSGPLSIHCQNCPFYNNCMGAYFSDFEIFGNNIVSVPKEEAEINYFQRSFKFYTEQAIEKMVFSPYLNHELRRNGYTITNYLSGETTQIRLKTKEILHLQKMLFNGVSLDELILCLNEFGLNGVAVVDEWMRKGVIE